MLDIKKVCIPVKRLLMYVFGCFSYVKMPPTSKVHQLQAPERGQSTLPYERRRAREEEEEEN